MYSLTKDSLQEKDHLQFSLLEIICLTRIPLLMLLPNLTRIRKPYFNQLPGIIFLIDQRTLKLFNPFKIKEFLFDSNSENFKTFLKSKSYFTFLMKSKIVIRFIILFNILKSL